MKKKRIIIIVVVAIVIICAVYITLMLNEDKIDKVMSNLETTKVTDTVNNENATLTETTSKEQTSVEKNYTYDDLQEIFLKITPKTTLDDFLTIIEEYKIEQMHQEYKTMDGKNEIVYKIAYENKVAWLSHADAGDYLRIGFDENKNLQYAEYFNLNAQLCDGNNIYTAYLENEADSTIGNIGYYGKYSVSATESNYKNFSDGKSVINCIIDNAEKYLQENNAN